MIGIKIITVRHPVTRTAMAVGAVPVFSQAEYISGEYRNSEPSNIEMMFPDIKPVVRVPAKSERF